MSNSSTGKVVTVLGEISPDELGVTLTHEHLSGTDIFLGLGGSEDKMREFFPHYRNPRPWLRNVPIDITNIDLIRRDPFCNADNLRPDLDPEIVIKEVMYFKMAGGGTICDVTPGGGNNPIGLKMISSATGVHIIAGCGYYMQRWHPPHVAKSSIEELAKGLIQDLTMEMGKGTGIRAGIIGELGVNVGMHPDEKKVLRAAAIAQKETGAPISIHQQWALSKSGLEAADILLEEGVKPDRIIMDHSDGTMPNVDYACEIADKGIYVEYDTWGHELYIPQFQIGWGSDRDRINCFAELIKRGYVKQLLVSQDIPYKTELRSYGGWGYSYILEYVVPRMLNDEHLGLGKIRPAIEKKDIQTVLVENPKRVLSWH